MEYFWFCNIGDYNLFNNVVNIILKVINMCFYIMYVMNIDLFDLLYRNGRCYNVLSDSELCKFLLWLVIKWWI